MADIEVGVRCDCTGYRLTVNSRDRTGTPRVDRTLQDPNPEGRLWSVPTDLTCGPNEMSKQLRSYRVSEKWTVSQSSTD
ncbi:hypothetical protein PC123_g22499 [Phytophthora cactorum]|nr:hypothetical protein PC123_g22499 [Phytophthora cactorum]